MCWVFFVCFFAEMYDRIVNKTFSRIKILYNWTKTNGVVEWKYEFQGEKMSKVEFKTPKITFFKSNGTYH